VSGGGSLQCSYQSRWWLDKYVRTCDEIEIEFFLKIILRLLVHRRSCKIIREREWRRTSSKVSFPKSSLYRSCVSWQINHSLSNVFFSVQQAGSWWSIWDIEHCKMILSFMFFFSVFPGCCSDVLTGFSVGFLQVSCVSFRWSWHWSDPFCFDFKVHLVPT
jgi:hypothetical protein